MSPGNIAFVFAAAAAAFAATLVPSSEAEHTRSTESGKIQIGEVVANDQLHIISHPGRYGLGPELPGSNYAVFNNYLIRVDSQSGQVQSVIREVNKILD
ncbi:hypothetical protein [Paracoccus aerodenitrificans]|uniref:hypothetical protein n=1 Tax=Paracoccus aerodenitrificans TaxID=3017781 RepID=UPI0022F0A51D|nr:hypothetical protein [Paracoccus aerodenitrificans]WBU63378.1 hypothetical protein PAE61_13570 [Paracoccus aerodenitrificans]